jgi:anti-sigma-K factor RsiG
MTAPTPAAGGAGVDELLDPAFLEGIEELPMAEVRALRHQAEQEEVNLSYTRRLLQGRLDIVRRELQRRGPAHGLGRHQTVQPTSPEQFETWVNSLAPGVDLSDVPSLPDDKLEQAARSLGAGERSLSERRRGVQQVMDTVAGELARRYREGLADVAQLLADESRHG